MNSKNEFPVEDREWEIQERGMRAARDGGTGAMDPAAERYRRIANAVISAPRCEPPADFAAGVVEQIAVRDAGFERALVRGLLLVLAIASVVVTALYGSQWWQAMQGLTGGAPGWVLVCTGCVALSWMIGQLHRVADHAGS